MLLKLYTNTQKWAGLDYTVYTPDYTVEFHTDPRNSHFLYQVET